MRGYVFDPARLGRRREPREDPYLVVGRMLRDHLGGGDIFAEVRRRLQADPKFYALVQYTVRELHAATSKA